MGCTHGGALVDGRNRYSGMRGRVGVCRPTRAWPRVRCTGPGPGAMMMFGGSPAHVAARRPHARGLLERERRATNPIKQIAQAAAVDMKGQHEDGKTRRERACNYHGGGRSMQGQNRCASKSRLSTDQASRPPLQSDARRQQACWTPEQRARIDARSSSIRDDARPHCSAMHAKAAA